MTRVFIVHRWSGGPEDDWRPWLRSELEGMGCEVVVPAMPDTHVPVIEKWVGYLAELVGIPDEDTYFIGHSIGNQAILRYIETVQKPVGGAVFVAGWFNLKNLEDKETEAIARPWITTPLDLQKIARMLPRSTLVISTNDPYDAYEENVEKFRTLGSKIITLPDAGHITAESGFIELPVVRDVIAEWLGKPFLSK